MHAWSEIFSRRLTSQANRSLPSAPTREDLCASSRPISQWSYRRPRSTPSRGALLSLRCLRLSRLRLIFLTIPCRRLCVDRVGGAVVDEVAVRRRPLDDRGQRVRLAARVHRHHVRRQRHAQRAADALLDDRPKSALAAAGKPRCPRRCTPRSACSASIAAVYPASIISSVCEKLNQPMWYTFGRIRIIGGRVHVANGASWSACIIVVAARM